MLAEIPLEGRIVADSYVGNTHILVSDAAYAGKSQEDLQHVLDEAAMASLNIIIHNRERKNQEG